MRNINLRNTHSDTARNTDQRQRQWHGTLDRDIKIQVKLSKLVSDQTNQEEDKGDRKQEQTKTQGTGKLGTKRART